MWADVKPRLATAGWDVVAPDLPGPDAADDLGAWADRLLRTVDGPIVPVGASMGGYVCFELWRRARERIRALGLVSTRASGETDESRRGRDDNIRLLDEDGVVALWARLEPKLFAETPASEVVARAREIALEQGAERLATALAAIRDRADATALLAEMDVPVLVVAGDGDLLIDPSEADAMAQALPRPRLVRVPGAGHLVPLERPEEFASALVSFLDESVA